jgi:serine/threonine protein kinase
MEFRKDPKWFAKTIDDRINWVPYELRRLLEKMLRINPKSRYNSIADVRSELAQIRDMHTAYQFAVKKTESFGPGDYRQKHLRDTEIKLKQLEPNASYAELIAARMHDIQSHHTVGSLRYYDKYKREHAAQNAQTAKAMLSSLGLSIDKLIEQVYTMIFYHEHKADGSRYSKDWGKQITRLKIADTTAFLEENFESYEQEFVGEPQRIGQTVRYMLSKIPKDQRNRLKANQAIMKNIKRYL